MSFKEGSRVVFSTENPSVAPDLTRLELATCAWVGAQSHVNIAQRIET